MTKRKRWVRRGTTPAGVIRWILGFYAFGAAEPAAVWSQVPTWILERGATIGDALDAERGFSSVGDVIVDGDRILVEEPLEHRIRVLSVDGAPLGSIGGRGGGPGEFESLDAMGLHDGLLWVADGDLGRVQFFDAEYRYARSVPIWSHPSLPPGRWDVIGMFGDGSLLVRAERYAHEVVADPRRPDHVIRLDHQNPRLDTVSAVVGLPFVVEIQGRPGWRDFGVRPVYDRSVATASRYGLGLVVVHREVANEADPHTYRVVRFDAEGDTAWVRDYSYDPIRVTDEWLSRRVEDWVQRASTGVDLARYRRAVEEAFSEPRFFPPVRSARAGEDGTTWLLLRTGMNSAEWVVLDTSGQLIGRLEPPEENYLIWPDWETPWFVEYDEFDVPYLVQYRVRRN